MTTSHQAPHMPARIPWIVWIVVGIVAGVALGLALGERARGFGEVALVFVKVLKVFATPLVFFAVLETLLRTAIAPRRAVVMLAVSSMNALVAVGIAWGLSEVVPLDRLVTIDKLRGIAAPADQTSALAKVISTGLDRMMVHNLLLVIAAAIVLGLALRFTAYRPRWIAQLLAFLTRVLSALVRGVPIALGCIVAKVIGTGSVALLPALGAFVAVVVLAMAIHVFGYYSLLVRGLLKRSPRAFFGAHSKPLLTAMSTGSSLATLPVTLKSLSDAGVSDESARLAACVGTNLNHDGILLYEAMAAFFVAALYAIPLATAVKLKIMATSVAAAIGIAGVPEAGLITLSLVLSAAGLPLEAVPLLLPVDWLLGRFRATTNVASDLVVATLIDGPRD